MADVLIRIGQLEQLDEIMGLMARCIQVMRDSGSDQWDETYPNREVIAEDLRRGTLFAAESGGVVVGIVVLDERQDEEYESIVWRQPEGPNLIMHRLAVDPAAQGRGIARTLIAYAERFAQQNGYRSIRLDTYAKNASALKLYRGLGYDQRGEVNFPRRVAVFPVFEKVFSDPDQEQG